MAQSLFENSVISGLTLGLETEASGVWINFGAIAMHKFVIAFSVGVELVSSQVLFFIRLKMHSVLYPREKVQKKFKLFFLNF
jgi:hypothetical protein